MLISFKVLNELQFVQNKIDCRNYEQEHLDNQNEMHSKKIFSIPLCNIVHVQCTYIYHEEDALTLQYKLHFKL